MDNIERKIAELSIDKPPLSPPWVELPLEITANILKRLGAIEILESAQRVCTTWWKVSRDPTMWHVIDMKNDYFDRKDVVKKMCRNAVDRSQGQLLKISIQNFGDNDLLNYIAERSSQLRHLRLVNCADLTGGLAAAAKNFPSLEELHISFTWITEDDIEIAGRSCPLLKSFILSTSGYDKRKFPASLYDDQALAIARSMPGLRHLVIIDSSLTNGVLQAILDGCPHLELFDLRCSCCDFGKRRGRPIVDLKHPCDSTHDDEVDPETWHYGSSGYDAFSDVNCYNDYAREDYPEYDHYY